MKINFELIKDFIVIATPIAVAIINIFNNRKTKKETTLEIEKIIKEKDAETSQLLAKISAELESQKQLSMWQSSLPQTEKYINEVGLMRYTNISGISQLIAEVQKRIVSKDITIEELKNIKEMLLRIELPINENDAKLYPYEIPFIIDFRQLIKRLDDEIFQRTLK